MSMRSIGCNMTGRYGVYVKLAGAEKCLCAILRRIFRFRWFRLSEPIPDRDGVDACSH